MQKVIIVLGMHRSGTSCLAGVLEKAGVNLGKVSINNPHNLKGNRENFQIMKLHDELLTYNNGTWDDPPASVSWPAHLEKKRDLIIAGYKNYPLWGFKDPRTLLLLDGWLRVLPNCILAATFRHPVLVVESLQRRNKKIAVEKSLLLWKIYNEKLLHYQKIYNFPVISFDLDEIEYKKKMLKLMDMLNLNLIPQGIEFFDNLIRHQNKMYGLNIPKNLIRLYRQLQESSI